MKTTPMLLRTMVAIGAVCACSHANQPCPAYRDFDRVPPPPLAASDPATVNEVEAARARYEICPNGRDYIVAREGTRELNESEALRFIKQGFFAEGMQSASLGGCDCTQTKAPRLCIVVSLPEGAATPVDVARRLVTSTIDERLRDPTVRVRITILSAPGRRCAAGDPACGPVPFGAACVEKTDYRPEAARHVVVAGVPGQCAHDGECRRGACEYECVPGTAMPSSSIACDPVDVSLKRAYCGCVSTACSWFTIGR